MPGWNTSSAKASLTFSFFRSGIHADESIRQTSYNSRTSENYSFRRFTRERPQLLYSDRLGLYKDVLCSRARDPSLWMLSCFTLSCLYSICKDHLGLDESAVVVPLRTAETQSGVHIRENVDADGLWRKDRLREDTDIVELESLARSIGGAFKHDRVGTRVLALVDTGIIPTRVGCAASITWVVVVDVTVHDERRNRSARYARRKWDEHAD